MKRRITIELEYDSSGDTLVGEYFDKMTDEEFANQWADNVVPDKDMPFLKFIQTKVVTVGGSDE